MMETKPIITTKEIVCHGLKAYIDKNYSDTTPKYRFSKK